MIHGASTNLREWTMTVFDRVAEDHHAIAIDRPGHGWSQRPEGDAHDPRVQARYVHGAMREIGIDRAILVGHSWGGTLVLAQALDYPKSVSGILFLASVSHSWPGGVSAVRNVAATPMLGPLMAHTVVPMAVPFKKKAGAKSVFVPNSMPDNYLEDAGIELYVRPSSFIADTEDVVHLKPIVRKLEQRYHEINVPLIALTVSVRSGRVFEVLGLPVPRHEFVDGVNL